MLAFKEENKYFQKEEVDFEYELSDESTPKCRKLIEESTDNEQPLRTSELMKINQEKEKIPNFPKIKVHKVKTCPTIENFLEKTDKIPKYYKCEPKYLSRNNLEKVALCCYPRSGCSLLRKYIEEISNIITGSDSNIEDHLVASLINNGMVGETITSQKVWMVKTHYPNIIQSSQFKAKK